MNVRLNSDEAKADSRRAQCQENDDEICKCQSEVIRQL
jgi:hypothetical protein